VPLIVRWPGVTKAGTENATPVISMDLTATILDATGIELASNESLDGVSLRPLFEGKELTRDALFFHYPHFAFHKDNRPGSAIRRDNFKLILNYDDDSTELYDLENDPGERQNLAGSHPELTAKLRHRLKGWLEETKAGRPTRRE
jgi:arylsulfatase A-like enzyme